MFQNILVEKPKPQKPSKQKGAVYEVVSESDQKRALRFLEQNIFETPEWLLQNDIFVKTGKKPMSVVESLQNSVLDRILSSMVLNKMYNAQLLDPKAYPLVNYMSDVQQSIFNNEKPDIYQRNLQRNYVNYTFEIVE